MPVTDCRAQEQVSTLLAAARGEADEAAVFAQLDLDGMPKDDALALAHAATGHRDRSKKAAVERIRKWYDQQCRWRNDERRVAASVDRALSRQ